jgi:hypothetical protein
MDATAWTYFEPIDSAKGEERHPELAKASQSHQTPCRAQLAETCWSHDYYRQEPLFGGSNGSTGCHLYSGKAKSEVVLFRR